MNLETVNLDDYLARNAIPQFITDLESAWRDDMKNAGQNTKLDPPHGTNSVEWPSSETEKTS